MTLDRANLLGFLGKLPKAKKVLPGLDFALAELFCVRTNNEHLPTPKYDAGFRDERRDLSRFKVEAVVDGNLREAVSTYQRPEASDVRSYAYGHDVAGLLLAAYGNALKNQVGLRSRDAVEGALRSAIQAVGSYRQEGLFKGLEAWMSVELGASGEMEISAS